MSQFSCTHTEDAVGLFRHHITEFAYGCRVVNAHGCRLHSVQDTGILAAGWWADSFLLAGVAAHPRLPSMLAHGKLHIAL